MRKPSLSTVISLLALFVALGGPAQAAKLISGSKIKANSVTSKQIRNHTLTATDIRASTLASLKRQSSSVTSANIVDGTIALADMGPSSVTGNQVTDHSLTAVDLAPASITGTELATGAITSANLAADSVQTAAIKDSQVTKVKVAADAIATSEVRDGTLTTADVGKTTGKVNATFNVAPQSCSTQDFTGTTYAIPAGALAGTIVLVGSPADNGIVTARPADANTLRIQVCNPTLTAITVAGDFPYVAFATA